MRPLESLFQYDIFETKCEDICASFVENNGSEYYQISFTTNGEGRCFGSETAPINTYWVKLFDSKRINNDNEMLYKLENFRKQMQLEQYDLLVQKPLEEIVKIAKKDVNLYKGLVLYHPAFLMIFIYVYNYIYSLIEIGKEHKNNTNGLERFEIAKMELESALESLLIHYKGYDRYVRDCLVSPYQKGKILSTGYVVAAYEKFLAENMDKQLVSIFKTNTNPTWEHVINRFSCGENWEIISSDFTFERQFIKGMYYCIDNNLMFKVCPVCKRYFVTKSTLLIKYCTRIFRNGKTCQEIGIRSKYTEKKAADPIHTVYLKEYNKQYARIRRKSITEEDAKISELRSLRDEYEKKYQQASEDVNQDNIVEEFKVMITNLYSCE